MTVLLFFARTAQVELPRTFIEAEAYVKARRNPPTGFVGRLPVAVSDSVDERREHLIETYGWLVEQQIGLAQDERDPAEALRWRMKADICKQQMESLIAGRRPEFVRSLEIRRGLI